MPLLAQQDPKLAMAFVACVFVALGIGALYLYRWYEAAAKNALMHASGGLRVHLEPQPGDVIISFHTYHGLIAWFTQTDHRVALPAVDAKILLNRLLWFNLSWGILTWGALFIPILSLINYRQQLRSVDAQTKAGGYKVPIRPEPVSLAVRFMAESEGAVVSTTDSLTKLKQTLGWILTGFSIIFAISAVFQFAFGDAEIGIGLLVVSAVFGMFTKDWTRRPGR